MHNLSNYLKEGVINVWDLRQRILYSLFWCIGFRSKILSNDENIFLRSVLNLINRATEKDWGSLKIVSFSDNVIVAIRSNVVDALEKLCHYAARIQELMLRNQQLLLRGAITKGNLYIQDNFVFGSGLVKVVELEETKAVVSRIIIDENLQSEDYAVNSKNTVQNDNDGIRFINFLNYYHPFINKNDERKKNFLELHNSFVLIINDLTKQIEDSNDNLKSSLYKKRSWLIDYINKIYTHYDLYRWLDIS